jgi:uncharacterized protein
MIKILSIDGGGIRGIISAIIIEQIEKQTGKHITETFDLIAGTSVGGIIALTLACPNTFKKPKFVAKDLIELFKTKGQNIFNASIWKSINSLNGLSDEKYDHNDLNKVLKEYLGQESFGNALSKLLISSYDIENRKTCFFKSWHQRDKNLKMIDIARATSAAPTYYEPTKMNIENKELALIDGGVFANNPGMCAYAEAKKIYGNNEQILIISIGTGELTRPILYKDAKNWGLAEWAGPLSSIVFDGISDAVDYQLNLLLGDKYFRFQPQLKNGSEAIDNASEENINALINDANSFIVKNWQLIENAVKYIVD